MTPPSLRALAAHDARTRLASIQRDRAVRLSAYEIEWCHTWALELDAKLAPPRRDYYWRAA